MSEHIFNQDDVNVKQKNFKEKLQNSMNVGV
jgi:hypothetical protein